MGRAERRPMLGLRAGRCVDGIVDSYGPPEPAAIAEAKPPVDPRALVAQAGALPDELPDGCSRDHAAGGRALRGRARGDS